MFDIGISLGKASAISLFPLSSGSFSPSNCFLSRCYLVKLDVFHYAIVRSVWGDLSSLQTEVAVYSVGKTRLLQNLLSIDTLQSSAKFLFVY